MMLGARRDDVPEEEQADNHSPYVVFDDSVLGDQAALLAHLAVRQVVEWESRRRGSGPTTGRGTERTTGHQMREPHNKCRIATDQRRSRRNRVTDTLVITGAQVFDGDALHRHARRAGARRRGRSRPVDRGGRDAVGGRGLGGGVHRRRRRREREDTHAGPHRLPRARGDGGRRQPGRVHGAVLAAVLPRGAQPGEDACRRVSRRRGTRAARMRA